MKTKHILALLAMIAITILTMALYLRDAAARQEREYWRVIDKEFGSD